MKCTPKNTTSSCAPGDRSRWILLWWSVQDVMTLGVGRRRRRHRSKVVQEQQQASRTSPDVSRTDSSGDEDCDDDEEDCYTRGDLAASALAGLRCATNNHLPLLRMVIALPPPPPSHTLIPDYGDIVLLSRAQQQRKHFPESASSVALRKKWVSDNGSVSSISTITMDPALKVAYLARNQKQLQQQQELNHTMFTMDSILCEEQENDYYIHGENDTDDVGTNCCSSLTMGSDFGRPTEASLSRVAPVLLMEI